MTRPSLLLAAASCTLLVACATAAPVDPGPERYRLSGSGTGWHVSGKDRVLDDLRPRYAAFFDVMLDPERTDELDLHELRDHIEHAPVTRANYDALNAVAIAYFELNARAEQRRGEALYFANSTQAAKLVAVPWRAYGEVGDPALRSAILDFFEDIASGRKRFTRRTASRLVKTVASLAAKEPDPTRATRIRQIATRLGEPH